MGLFDKLFGRKQKDAAPSSSELARERLTLMLVHDRLKLTPDLLDRIKGELLAVISKYVEIDESGVDVELTHTEHSDKLVARMPVKRQRLPFQRDVLESGMGNPLAAAAALARIHQPPGAALAEAPAAELPLMPPVAESTPTASLTAEASPSAAASATEPPAPPPTEAAAPTAPAVDAGKEASDPPTNEVSAPEASEATPTQGAKRKTGPKQGQENKEAEAPTTPATTQTGG